MQPDWEQTRALLRRLRWTVIEPLARRPNGDERSRLVGPGVEFASVREYQPGDDVRRIDWSLTARLNSPYVREAQAEGALDVWLAVDVSGSVDWGTAECLKRYRAIELAAVTGQLLGRHANRLGLLLFADRPVGLIPPGQGRMHLDRLAADAACRADGTVARQEVWHAAIEVQVMGWCTGCSDDARSGGRRDGPAWSRWR